MRYVVLSLLLLTGCAREPVKLIAPEYKIVKPPNDFYNCPIIKNFPNADNLTNQQVGSLLLKTQQNNLVCKNSIDQIKKYMDDAEISIGKNK